MGQFLIDGDKGAPAYVFAHGAGAAMDSEFMTSMAQKIASHGVRVIRFEFPYMQQQRLTGKRRPPDRQPKLLDYYDSILDELGIDNPVIGGKSMGGRMASILAVERGVAGVAVVGYPFHAQGKPEKVRIDHLGDIKAPVLICQGERDAMGNLNEVMNYRLPESICIEWFADGNHDLKPRKLSGECHEKHIQRAVEMISSFVLEVSV